MKRIIQYGLILLLSLFLLVGGLLFVVVSVDSNAFKPIIQYWVKKNTQRSFVISGDLQIVFYPQIDIQINDMTLSEFENDDQFASIEHAQFSLSLWPLLRKQMIVDTVQIAGLNARLIRYQDGRMNIDDLLEEDAQPLTFSLDLGRAEIAMSRVVFQDEMTQQTLVLDDVHLTTDRITAESIGQVNYSSQLIKKAGIDADVQTYQMGLDSRFEIEFDARNILFNDCKFLSGPIAASIQDLESDNHLNAIVSISDLHQSSDHLSSKHLRAELKSRQNEYVVKIVLVTSLAARLDDQQWTFPGLETNVTFSRSESKRPVHGHFVGHIDLDILSELLHFELQGMLVDSHLDAAVQLQGFSEQNVQFKIQSDRLDLNPLLPFLLQQSESHTNTEKKIIQQAENNTFPLPDLLLSKHLNLNGAIYIEQLLVGDIRASGIQLSIEPEQNHFDLNKPVH